MSNWVSFVTAVVLVVGACSKRSSDHDSGDGSIGGSGATGGSAGSSSGRGGSGGSGAIGGSGATGGIGATGGDVPMGGTAGVGGTGCGSFPGTVGVSPVPFRFVQGAGAGEGAGGQGGASGEGGMSGEGGVSEAGAGGTAGCSACATTTELSVTQVTCAGTAVIEAQPVGPSLSFCDGSRLLFDDAGPGLKLYPPLTGSVWVEYGERVQEICPFCGSHTDKTIIVSRERGGEVLYAGLLGLPIDDQARIDVMSLFGVSTRREQVCRTASTRFDCYDTTYDIFDQILETTPEQRIPYGVLVSVDSPRGEFQVHWTTADVEATRIDMCYDGGRPRHTRNLAAVRLDP